MDPLLGRSGCRQDDYATDWRVQRVIGNTGVVLAFYPRALKGMENGTLKSKYDPAVKCCTPPASLERQESWNSDSYSIILSFP